MTLEQAYTRALATLQGIVQKLGAAAVGPTYMNVIAELETDWSARAASARLIAAAPKLLEALRFYANPENWKEHDTGIGTFPGEAVDYGARAQAAIAKAEDL